MRWLPASLCALAACASDGNPWGVARVSADVSFDPAERLEAGRVRTSSDYLLEVESLILTPDAVAVTVTEDAGALSFDPANPPPGYSLCHNGHCHADDGRLVDYAVIEAELAGGGAGGFRLALAATGAVEIHAAPDPIPLAGCEGPCWLEAGELGTFSIALRSVAFRVRAFDGSGQGRLPPGGAVFLADAVPVGSSVTVALDGAVGEDAPLGYDFHASLRVTPRLFDRIDWSAFSAGDVSAAGALTDQLVENLLTSDLAVNLERFEVED